MLFIRADADLQIGVGHVMRCLALAQAWIDSGGEVIFATACRNEGILERIRAEGVVLHSLSAQHPDPKDWIETKDILASSSASWVVLDGYHLDEDYQQRVKQAGYRLLVIDDMAHLEHYYADMILNQNLSAQQLDYGCEADTQLLLGSKYVLLRREFTTCKDRDRGTQDEAKRVLVTLGGSDPDNYTSKVIEAILMVDVPGLEVIVLVGASNPHLQTLETKTKESDNFVRLIQNAQNMPEMITWSDMAICTGGTTLWEMMFFGIPVIVLALAENQVLNAQAVEQCGVGKNLGWAKDVNVSLITETADLLMNSLDMRAQMGETGRRLVDGQGAKRVVTCMQGSGVPV